MHALLSRRLVRLSLVAAILLPCVGCDQYTKTIAQARLKGRPPHSYFGDMFRLEYAENPGAFLGLGGQLPPTARSTILILLNCTIATGLVIALILPWRATPLQLVGCGLLLAGAVGNLIDRLRLDGLVVDFMNLGVGPLRSGIFNVADVAITTGAVLLALPVALARPAEPAAPSPAKP